MLQKGGPGPAACPALPNADKTARFEKPLYTKIAPLYAISSNHLPQKLVTWRFRVKVIFGGGDQLPFLSCVPLSPIYQHRGKSRRFQSTRDSLQSLLSLLIVDSLLTLHSIATTTKADTFCLLPNRLSA
jgi:hypothetical protein